MSSGMARKLAQGPGVFQQVLLAGPRRAASLKDMSSTVRAERSHPMIKHAPVLRASLAFQPRALDLLGAKPSKDAVFLHERRAQQRAGSRLDVFA
jgi:hypothetical protein